MLDECLDNGWRVGVTVTCNANEATKLRRRSQSFYRATVGMGQVSTPCSSNVWASYRASPSQKTPEGATSPSTSLLCSETTWCSQRRPSMQHCMCIHAQQARHLAVGFSCDQARSEPPLYCMMSRRLHSSLRCGQNGTVRGLRGGRVPAVPGMIRPEGVRASFCLCSVFVGQTSHLMAANASREIEHEHPKS